MQPAMPQQPPQPQATPQQGQAGQPPGQQKATPEQQAMYETIVGQTEETIYQRINPIKERLQQGAEDGVGDDIGAIVGKLMVMNYQSARQAGKSIPPIIILGAFKELTEVVADIALQMGLVSQQELNAEADEALYVGLGTFGKGTAQLMPPEEKQQYQQMLTELETAEAQVRIQQGPINQNPATQPAPQQQPAQAPGQPQPAGAIP